MYESIRQNLFNIELDEYEKLPELPIESITKQIIKNNEPSSIDKIYNDSIHIFKSCTNNSKHLYIHESFDIICNCQGDLKVSICGDVVTVHRGNFIFISPCVPYVIRADKDCIAPVFSINKGAITSAFHRVSLLNGILSKFFANGIWGDHCNTYIHFKHITNHNMYNLIPALIYEEVNPQEYSVITKLNLTLTMLSYIGALDTTPYELSSLKTVKSDQILKILTHIQNNYRTITLEELALTFHYTVPYVSKLIRTSTGFTFTEILREIKFEVCLSLLMNSDLKINRIAEVAGFQNTDHFNRIFKKRTGETPSEYRKNKTNNY